MTLDELKTKIDVVCRRCISLKQFSLSKIKQMIDSPTTPNNLKIYYQLEYNFRLNGGYEPYLIILQKMEQEWGCKLGFVAPYVEVISIP